MDTVESSHVVGGTTLLHWFFAKIMDIWIEVVSQDFDEETVSHFERNYTEFISTFTPDGPALCINGFANEEVEARNTNRKLSRSPYEKIPALGYYIRKELSGSSEDDIQKLVLWIGEILAAGYLGSAVFVLDAPVEQQAIRSPDELLRIWGPAAYLYGPSELGFTDEPPLFFILASILADDFYEFLEAKGISKKKKLESIVGHYILAGYIMRRLDVCEPGNEPDFLMMQAARRDLLAEESEVK